MKGAPSGAVILSWLSCNLKDADLLERNDLLVCGKSKQQGDTDDMNRESGVSNRECRLGRWSERKITGLGQSDTCGGAARLVDSLHPAMHLWSQGDLAQFSTVLDAQALRKSEVIVS